MTRLSKPHRVVLVLLLSFDVVVLLGQLWPEGAPPFAPIVNVGFLLGAAVYFGMRLAGRA